MCVNGDCVAQCPALLECRLYCRNGYETDAKGCRQCQCRETNPCEGVKCRDHQTCRPLSQIRCIRAPCPEYSCLPDAMTTSTQSVSSVSSTATTSRAECQTCPTYDCPTAGPNCTALPVVSEMDKLTRDSVISPSLVVFDCS